MVVYDLLPWEVPSVVGDHLHDDALGMRANPPHLTVGVAIDAVAIMIGHDEAVRGGALRLIDKANESTAQRHRSRPLPLEHLADHAVLELEMPGSFGIGNALILEPGVDLVMPKAPHSIRPSRLGQFNMQRQNYRGSIRNSGINSTTVNPATTSADGTETPCPIATPMPSTAAT